LSTTHSVAKTVSAQTNEATFPRSIIQWPSSWPAEKRCRSLEGAAYDTLFKQLCGEGQLRTDENRAVLAPFSFVSIMAGAYLALEFAQRIMSGDPVRPFNFWKISPWYEPMVDLRRMRERNEKCEFCGNAVVMQVAVDIWGATTS
jgi:hypothetical protein